MIKNVKKSLVLDKDYTKIAFEEIQDFGEFYQIKLPYVYFESKKAWYRIHSGGGNVNGVSGAKIFK